MVSSLQFNIFCLSPFDVPDEDTEACGITLYSHKRFDTHGC